MWMKYVWVAVAGSAIVLAGSTEEVKLYKVKSGKIDYAIKGSGDIMGMKMKTIGKKRMIFTNYGALSLTEENKITKQSGMGQARTEKSHTMTYMKNGVAYNVDFERKKIMRMGNMRAIMGMMGGGQADMAQAGEKMLKQMGGKKIGTDKVLGYTCDVWEVMGTKQCLYKGVTLKIITNIMGIKNTEVATKAEFDIDLSESDFKLPDFPVVDMNGRELEKASLGAMDATSQKEADQAIQLMQQMSGAMQQAGVEPGKAMTPAQESAMMDAMLPMMKQQMLSEEADLRKARQCIEKADTLDEVKQCAREMDGEDSSEGMPKVWNSQTKKQTLEEIDRALDGMACVKRAKNMQEARSCMEGE
jgi:hypothetical protein